MKPLNFDIEGIFFLRTPLFPISNLAKPIEHLLNDEVFLESIFLASPQLYSQIGRLFLEETDSDTKNKILKSLQRYQYRMSYRCTPFGTFAGVSIGNFSDETTIYLPSIKEGIKKSRLDTHFVSNLVNEIVKNQIIRREIKWYSNNTIYESKNTLRYVEYRLDENIRVHHLSSVELTSYLQEILLTARSGAFFNDLLASLVSSEISEEEACEFLNELIDSKLLISELEMGVTGESYPLYVQKKIQGYESIKTISGLLGKVINSLSEIDRKHLGSSTADYLGLEEQIKAFQIPYNSSRLFQVDTVKPLSHKSLNKNLAEELKNAVSLLFQISDDREPPNLTSFKEKFYERYEEEEVPLLKVLDTEMGVGYPVSAHSQNDNSPLLDGIELKSNDSSKSAVAPSPWSKYIGEKYVAARKNHDYEIEIKESEVGDILNRKSSKSIPPSFLTIGSVLAKSANAIDLGDFQIFHISTSGPSAANLSGRFCFADKQINDAIKQLLTKEDEHYPDKIVAEIVHVPQSHIGNVSMRPSFRPYEIPILNNPGVDHDHTIRLDDIMVSVPYGRKIVLRSKKFNKEIIPRLTTAHNYSQNPLPVYHFLCDLQFQGLHGYAGWNWGSLTHYDFLPRVRFGKTILAKAKWRLRHSEIFSGKNCSINELHESLLQHCKERGIPNAIAISEYDNELPLDLEKTDSLTILLEELKKKKEVFIEENLVTKENIFAQGPQGQFTNEIIIPWHTTVKPDLSFSPGSQKQISSIRKYGLGSEWLYLKVYCGVKTADDVLTEILNPLTEKLIKAGIIDKWFFIRYYDPDHHLRIRFHGLDRFYIEVIEQLNKLLNPYLEENLIWKVQVDTYCQEIERYGVNNITNSENLFFYDSVATVKILGLLEGDEGDGLRWLFAIKGVNDLLNSFSYTIKERKELMMRLSANFQREFNADNSETKKQMSLKYRVERNNIHLALQSELEPEHPYSLVWEIFSERARNISNCVDVINDLYSTGKVKVDRSDLVASYIHMHLNRFFRSKQRVQEMVIYDLLHQYYKSTIAIESKKTNEVTQRNFQG